MAKENTSLWACTQSNLEYTSGGPRSHRTDQRVSEPFMWSSVGYILKFSVSHVYLQIKQIKSAEPAFGSCSMQRSKWVPKRFWHKWRRPLFILKQLNKPLREKPKMSGAAISTVWYILKKKERAFPCFVMVSFVGHCVQKHAYWFTVCVGISRGAVGEEGVLPESSVTRLLLL